MTRCACGQAVVLVGGQGTRLRPITARVPKPLAPLLGKPFVAYVLDNFARHGVKRVVFSAGYLASAIEAEVGDGSRWGLDVRYVVEERPLGTAGAIRNAMDELEEATFFACNGDVLTDADLTALAAFHRVKGARATLLLTLVDDPRRYGMVELAGDGAVAEFIEKPGADLVGPALINAGVYVLEPEVLAGIAPGQACSIERGVFPDLAAAGQLYGYASDGYWCDIGTPESYLQAHFDLLEGALQNSVGQQSGQDYLSVAAGVEVAAGARLVPPAFLDEGAVVAAGAHVGPLAVIGKGSRVEAGAHVTESVLQEGVIVGPRARVERSIVVRGAAIGEAAVLSDVVVGDGCRVGEGNVLACGLRLWPDVELPAGSISFREIERPS